MLRREISLQHSILRIKILKTIGFHFIGEISYFCVENFEYWFMMLNYLLVFIGGGLGSICRYGIAHFLSTQNYHFPLATLIANVLSCIILGALIGLNLKGDVSNTQKFLLMTGFCGGFSTFSTFTAETYQLFQSGDYFYALANIGFSLLLCLICIYLGLKIVS